MARVCFFSFRYAHVFRVNQIRSMPNIIGQATAGFKDASLWENAKGNEHQIKRMINEGLHGTSVTVVCITYGINTREWVNYEIEQSLKQRNGLLGIQIHHLKDPTNPDPRVGAAPRQIEENGFKIYQYTNREQLAQHIEEAARIAGR